MFTMFDKMRYVFFLLYFVVTGFVPCLLIITKIVNLTFFKQNIVMEYIEECDRS